MVCVERPTPPQVDSALLDQASTIARFAGSLPGIELVQALYVFIWEAVNMLDHHRVVGTDVVELPWPLSSHSQHGGEPVRVSLNFERARACTARLVWETVFEVSSTFRPNLLDEEVGAEGGGDHGGPGPGSADAVPPSYRHIVGSAEEHAAGLGCPGDLPQLSGAAATEAPAPAGGPESGPAEVQEGDPDRAPFLSPKGPSGPGVARQHPDDRSDLLASATVGSSVVEEGEGGRLVDAEDFVVGNTSATLPSQQQPSRTTCPPQQNTVPWPLFAGAWLSAMPTADFRDQARKLYLEEKSPSIAQAVRLQEGRRGENVGCSPRAGAGGENNVLRPYAKAFPAASGEDEASTIPRPRSAKSEPWYSTFYIVGEG